MSTKTTLKRVSLVAVAAMGFGLLSVVPSSATPQSDTLTASPATSAINVGGTATTTITQSFIGQDSADSMSVTASLVSSPAGNAVLPTLAVGAGSVNTTPAIVGLVATSNSGVAGVTTGVITASLTNPQVAGTYIIKFTPYILNTPPSAATAAAVTWTVTVGATGTAVTATSFLNAGEGTAAIVDAVVSASMALNAAAQAASIVVTSSNAAPADVTPTTALTATITGPGALGISTVGNVATQIATGRSIIGLAGQNVIGVFSDGTAGVATITISAGTVALSTETVTFYGALTSFTATPVKTVIGIGSTDAVAITGKDAAGVAASVGTWYATSATPAVATVPAGAQTGGTITVTGVAVGTSVITIGNAATSPTISTTFTVTVGKATIKTLTMTTDKTSYSAGEKVTITVTALGSDGKPVGDVTLNAFSAAVTSNLAVQGTLPTAAIAFVGGVKTFVIYAPASASTVVLTGTEGSSTDNVIAGGTAATITASFDVTNAGADAATDAANAATDAANYAADMAAEAITAAQEATAAAVAAQESADAATAAVVALGLRVDTLLASVRAQLTSLANLIKRIVKKTHA